MEFRNQYKKRGVIEKPKSRKIINFLNMKMIKILSTVMFGVLLFSCGGKSTNKKDAVESETEKKEVVIATDCNCSELKGIENLKGITKNGSNELFTGVCVEKDQYDIVIREVTVKNGWLVKETKKKKVQKDYITLSEYNYENGEISTKWNIKMDENSDYYYVYGFKETKGESNDINFWTIDIINDEIFVTRAIENGVEYNGLKDYREKSKPKCFKNAEYYGGTWSEKYLSPEDLTKILDGLKSEFPHFNYWKK
jgi:hypothetical protein